MAKAKKKSINFPTKDALFHVALINLMYHLGIIDPDAIVPTGGTPLISWIRLNITPAKYNALLALFGTATTPNTWLYVYPLQKHKATRTGTLTEQKKVLKKKILAIIRPERTILKATEKTTPGTLTPSDATLFFIPEASPRTNSAETFRIGASVPLLSLSSVEHLKHTIDAHNPETPESKSLPEGVVFIWFMFFVGTVAPTDWTQFKHLRFSGKFRTISSFLASQAKQDVWYTACYISVTGEIGDFSPFLHATIAQTA